MAVEPYDVIIVGGGPAGLNAALVLGRCRRRVLVCDAGAPRNAASCGLHGFLSRDGILPHELLRLGREELHRYGVEYRRVAVSDARAKGDRFVVVTGDGETLSCRKLLLATGVKDKVPRIENIERFYGRSVFHCPYCDGWEVRDQPLAAYGRGKPAAGLAHSLLTWSGDVVLCTDGGRTPSSNGIRVIAKRIARLEGTGDVLERIVFTDGDVLPRRAIFFNTGQDQHCDLPEKFGCVFTSKHVVRTDRFGATNIPGLYVAGDASRDVQFVIVAAAEGAKAAVAINTSLQLEV
jgi:thioredoxin reductase